MKKRKRIAVDMDEVLAKYTKKVIKTLHAETGFEVDTEKIKGKFLSKSLDPNYIEKVTSYPYREGFFRDLEVMEYAPEVLKALQDHFDVFIVSATTQHANAPKSKLEWLQEHFPYIPFQNIVFCGDKRIIKADYLIDDHPKYLESFDGIPILFEAFHNLNETRFTRMRNWNEIAEYYGVQV